MKRLGLRPSQTAFGLLLATVTLTACSTPSWLCLAPPGPNRVTLLADPGANNDTAIAVDLVLITDKLAAQQLSALSAQEYFTRRGQFKRDFGAGIQVRSWELAPGQTARNMPVDPTCNRVETLLFVRYASAGDHRQVIDRNGSLVVSLNADDFTVSP